MMKKISDLAYVLFFLLFVILSTLLISEKSFSDNDLVDNDKNIETQSELAPPTTINKFETLSKYGYILQEINGKYCISLPSYQAEPFECFEDEQSALEDWEFRINLEDYRQGWVAQLLYYPPLNEEEYKITNDFLGSIEPGSTINLKIDGEDYSCIDKDSGTVQNRFANEIHPINLYEEGEEASSNLGYSVSLDYYCTQLADGSSFLLYGPLFYQDNQWWGFQESDNDYWKNYEKDIEILAFMTRFAKRVSLGVSINA
mgnify:CR=1 FL=1